MTSFRPMAAIALVATAALAMPAAAQSQSPAPLASAGPAASPGASVPAGPAITVVARDYHFEGLPTTIPVGTNISLQNQGQEVHEIVLVRRNDDATQTWDELLALPGDEALQYVTVAGQLFAVPGGTAEGTIVVGQEGDYLALCFVPQGTTSMPDPSAMPDASFPAGPPHFLLGMRQEVTVTAAGTEPGPLPSVGPAGSMTPGASMGPLGSPAVSSAP